MRRHGFARDDTALHERGCEAPSGTHNVVFVREDGMRFEARQRSEPKPPCDCTPFQLLGDKVESIAVANPIEPQVMREWVGHPSLPSISAVKSAWASASRKSRSVRLA